MVVRIHPVAPILGQLSRVDVREVWEHEATCFTPWLAREENLQLLAEAIDMHLILEGREAPVGMFRADLIARDVHTGHLVLIENRLERTDHGHLGQLLAYAAGLRTVSIVWVSSLFTDEHRAALDWLNEITDTSIAFFGLEMELWRIWDSAIAPKFNLVSKPNMFSKLAGQVRAGDFNKGAFVRSCFTKHPGIRNAEIMRVASEQGQTNSTGYVSHEPPA